MTQAGAAAGGSGRAGRHRRCVVTAVTPQTPRMVRVSLAGDDLVGARPAGPDQRVKLLFPVDRRFTGDPAELAGARRRRRTYTLLHLDPEAGTADIDFVLHGEGVASTWAGRARPGDEVELAGPMGRFALDPTVRDHLLVADETGLPALEAILLVLPTDARAEVHVEVADDAERRALPDRDGIDVTWWSRAKHGAGPGGLMTELGPHLRTRGPDALAWIAGEASAVVALRAHVQGALQFDRRRVTAVAYWTRGAAGGD